MNVKVDVIDHDGPQKHADAIRAFVQATRGAVPNILRAEARLTAQLASRFTPSQGGKRQGERAVTRDVNRAIRAIRPEQFENPRLRNLAATRNLVALNQAIEHFGAVELKFPGGLKVPIRQVVPFDSKLHSERRDQRGRIQRNKRIGTLDELQQAAYVERMKSNVGIAKAGWNPAITGLGGKITTYGSRGVIPAYVARHGGMGSIEDRAADPIKAFIQMRNFSPWARYKDEAERVTKNAMSSRGEIIMLKLLASSSDELKKALGKISNKSNAPF